MPPEFHGMARTASIDAHHHIGAGKIATINQNFAAAQLRSAALDVTNEVADTVEKPEELEDELRYLCAALAAAQ